MKAENPFDKKLEVWAARTPEDVITTSSGEFPPDAQQRSQQSLCLDRFASGSCHRKDLGKRFRYLFTVFHAIGGGAQR